MRVVCAIEYVTHNMILLPPPHRPGSATDGATEALFRRREHSGDGYDAELSDSTVVIFAHAGVSHSTHTRAPNPANLMPSSR